MRLPDWQGGASFLSGEAILLGRKTLRWGEGLTESAAVFPFGTSVRGVTLDDVTLAAEGTDGTDGDGGRGLLLRLLPLGALLGGRRLGTSLCRGLCRRFFRDRLFLCVCLYGCYPTDAIVGKNIGNNLCYLIFQLLYEALRVVLLMFDVAQFLLPDAGQLAALEQFFLDQVDQLHSRGCGHQALPLATDIVALEQGLDDAGPR